MTNNKISCNIIEDLLPNYIEKLTSEETNKEIETHLASCENCTEAYQRMIAADENLNQSLDDKGKEAEKQKVNFLKKIKKKNIIRIAVIIISLVVVFCGGYYFLEVRIFPVPVEAMEVGNVYQLPDGSIYYEIILKGDLANIDARSQVSYPANVIGNRVMHSTPYMRTDIGYTLSEKIKTMNNKREEQVLVFTDNLTIADEGEGETKITKLFFGSFGNDSESILVWEEGQNIKAVPRDIYETIDVD